MNAPTTPGERAFRLTAAVAGEMALTQQRGRATAAQVKDWSERLHWAASIVPPPYAYYAYGPPRGEILRAAARRHTAVASACSIDLDQIAERSITAPFIAIEARDVTGI